MMTRRILVLWLLAGGLLLVIPLTSADAAKRIYHWPYLKLDAYTSAQGTYYPHGDIDPKRAFYWGRVLGSDGVAFTLRNLLPHILEGNWQEPVYTNDQEKELVFARVKDFQDTYAACGCGDNFLQAHTHHPLYGEPLAQWRAAVVEGMRQKAELARFAGFRRNWLISKNTRLKKTCTSRASCRTIFPNSWTI